MNKFVFILKGLYLYSIILLWALLICSIDSLYDRDILIICIGSLFVLSYIGKLFLLVEELEIYTSWSLIKSILHINKLSVANRVYTTVIRIKQDKYYYFNLAQSQISTILTIEERMVLVLSLLKALRPYRGISTGFNIGYELRRIMTHKVEAEYMYVLPPKLSALLFLPELKNICANWTNEQKYEMLRSIFRELISKIK